jgi:hypothetical protein
LNANNGSDSSDVFALRRSGGLDLVVVDGGKEFG